MQALQQLQADRLAPRRLAENLRRYRVPVQRSGSTYDQPEADVRAHA